MKIAPAALAFLALGALAGGPAPDGTAAPAPPGRLFDDAQDRIVRSAFVPSEEQRQGEVRLVRRDGAAVMQTVLDTTILKRVVGEIRKKELASWPPGRAGHDDALRYIAALREARDRIQERAARRGRRAGRRRTLLIEFILSPDASLVAFAEPEVEEANGHMRVVARRPIETLALSRSYVRGDIYEIARDALGLGKKEAREVLEPLLPPESAEGAATSPPEGRHGDSR